MPHFDPSLAAGCLGALISCVKVTSGVVMVTQGLEKLATLSAVCLLHTFSHLSVIDPSSGVLADICQQYARIFPPNIEFNKLPFHHTFAAIHFTLHQGWRHQPWMIRQVGHQQVQWRDYKLLSWEDTVFTHALTMLAQSEYKRRKKVPCWILRFVLHTMGMNPLPSTLAVVNCLSIIAIGLDCDISEIGNMTPDERYVHV